jgi:enamine deaminase RidA (YjgF/YER057c/UK114 family)
MSIVRVKPGTRMSQAVVYGGLVYVAGQVASDETTVKGQTRLTCGRSTSCWPRRGLLRKTCYPYRFGWQAWTRSQK